MGGPRRTVGEKLKLLRMAEQLGRVAHACRVMGFSRDSYYRLKKRFERDGKNGLRPMSRRKPLPALRVAPEVERAVLKIARKHPTWGRWAVAKVLGDGWHGISPSGVRCVWARHGLATVQARLRYAGRTSSSPTTPRQQPAKQPQREPQVAPEDRPAPVAIIDATGKVLRTIRPMARGAT